MNTYNVVFHVDKRDGSITVAFTNAINYANALPDKSFSMALVVNSVAVTEIVAENKTIGTKLEEAVKKGLQIFVCQNALKANSIKPELLYPQCSVVEAGIVTLVELQQKGYAYIKP